MSILPLCLKITMTKNLSLLLLTILFFGVGNAQIVNSDFEDWSPHGGSCESPDDWGTLKGSTGLLGVCTTQKDTVNVQSGVAALRLETEFIGPPFNQTAPGICTNGSINTTSQDIEGGDAFTLRPDTMTGWYIAAPVNGDEYSFRALFMNGADTIGRAGWSDTTTVTTYTRFAAPVDWWTSQVPDMVQILLFSSDSDDPQPGSTVTFDNFGYTLSPTGLPEEAATPLFDIYPIPSQGWLQVRLNDHQASPPFNTPLTIEIFNLSGQRVQLREVNATTQMVNFDLTTTPNGIYLLKANIGHRAYSRSFTLAK